MTTYTGNERADRFSFERVLDECLERVRAGELPELVAARYPQFEPELRSELQTVQLLLAFFRIEGAPPELVRHSVKRRSNQLPGHGHA